MPPRRHSTTPTPSREGIGARLTSTAIQISDRAATTFNALGTAVNVLALNAQQVFLRPELPALPLSEQIMAGVEGFAMGAVPSVIANSDEVSPAHIERNRIPVATGLGTALVAGAELFLEGDPHFLLRGAGFGLLAYKLGLFSPSFAIGASIGAEAANRVMTIPGVAEVVSAIPEPETVVPVGAALVTGAIMNWVNTHIKLSRANKQLAGGTQSNVGETPDTVFMSRPRREQSQSGDPAVVSRVVRGDRRDSTIQPSGNGSGGDTE